MNERIEKIKFECLDWNVWTGRWELNANKFAELIVRECIYYAFCHGDDIEYVKKHFGVE